MRSSLPIIAFFFAGLFLGATDAIPALGDGPTLAALYALVLLVGIVIGGDPRLPEILKGLRAGIVAVPLSIIGGTLAGTLLYAALFDGPALADTLAIGAGYGYYSLSSVLINGFSGKTAGTIALLANMCREIFTILFSPLLVKWFGRLAPVSAGGATAMDTTLPIIVKHSGKDMAWVAVVSGLVLSLASPLLITLIYSVF